MRLRIYGTHGANEQITGTTLGLLKENRYF